MSAKVFNALFLCTGKSARIKPNGRVNPHAIALLNGIGDDTFGLRSKSWNEFEGPDAPQMGIIITVCDNAAGEACPFWPGQPATAQWGCENPHGKTEEQARRSFLNVFKQIRRRIEFLVNLSDAKLENLAFKQSLAEIATKPV